MSKLTGHERKKIVKTILGFIDKINYNSWRIEPGMATSADLLKELEDRSYELPKRLTKRFLGRILKDSGYFERVRLFDSRLTDRPICSRARIFYKKK